MASCGEEGEEEERLDLTPPAPLSLDIPLAHTGKQDRLRERGEESHLYSGSEPPLSKTIFLARTGKENVEGEGVGGEVYATLGRGSGRSDLWFSRWVWFRRLPCDLPWFSRL